MELRGAKLEQAVILYLLNVQLNMSHVNLILHWSAFNGLDILPFVRPLNSIYNRLYITNQFPVKVAF